MCEPDTRNLARHARGCSSYKVEASARAMAQLVLRVCETVYHSITKHVPRLVGTSGHTKARLETVVCEPSVREPCAFGAPISQTISTSEAFVRGNDWTSTGSSLVLLGHLARTTSALAEPWCAKVP